MKKTKIKAIAIALAVSSTLLVAAPIKTSATEIAKDSATTFNIPGPGFQEVDLSLDVQGNTVVTQSNLTNAAKELYAANPVEGQKVITILNHANYFSDLLYVNDGKLRGNKEAYKAAYVGAALNLYLQKEGMKWINALYSMDAFETCLDNGNASVGYSEFDYNSRAIYKGNESMISPFVISLVDQSLLMTTGFKEYSMERTVAGNRKLTPEQASIRSKNYAFASGAEADYLTAYNALKLHGYYDLRFNSRNDGAIKLAYGALTYLRAQKTNCSDSDAIDWLRRDARVDGPYCSRFIETYSNNMEMGYINAKAQGITTEAEAIELAKTLLAHKYAIAVNAEDYSFYALDAPSKPGNSGHGNY